MSRGISYWLVLCGVFTLLIGGVGCNESEQESQGERAKAKLTRQKIGRLVQSYTLWALDSNERCPESISQLAELATGKRVFADAWGREFVLECSEARVSIFSMGPDGKANTADDIRE